MIVRTKVGKKRIMTTFLGGLEEAVDESPKISKTSTEFPQRHLSTTPIQLQQSPAASEVVMAAAEKIDEERDVKNYLKNIKFDYETENNSKQTITVTNEITHGIGKRIARIWNLQENINSQIDGHIIGCDVNKQFLIIVKESNDLEMIVRETGKSRNICKLPETPKSIKLFGDWLIVLFMNQNFMLFNVSSHSTPLGQACHGSLEAFGKQEDGQLIIHNSQLIFITSNQKIFIGSIEKRKWIQANLPNSKFSRFPTWLFPALPSTSAGIFNQIINRISLKSFQTPSTTTFIPPSDQYIRALILPSEFQFFNFVNQSVTNLKECKQRQCKHFKDEKSGGECQICQIFYLLTKFSLNSENLTNKAIEY
uniref:CNH domain-containing protein n=1 Tax=Panagrolaimus davidi TaxID=227884 RepID=A0A914PQ75_9BILA